MEPIRWDELKCPHCGCLVATEGGCDELELGIGGSTGPCDACGALLNIEIAGPGPDYVITNWKPPGWENQP